MDKESPSTASYGRRWVSLVFSTLRHPERPLFSERAEGSPAQQAWRVAKLNHYIQGTSAADAEKLWTTVFRIDRVAELIQMQCSNVRDLSPGEIPVADLAKHSSVPGDLPIYLESLIVYRLPIFAVRPLLQATQTIKDWRL
ncbi:MAG TPA: hypothetical protein VGG56_00665 [Terracidiphilus sp.]|jgi:hypothetical protein